VIVSHDPTMVERVADRLWLVNDGACTNFDGDLEDYRKFTIQSRRAARKSDKEKKENKSVAPAQNDNERRKKAERAEKEIQRLTTEKEKLEKAMAVPGFYDNVAKSRETQSAYDGLTKELEIQEALWLEATA
jgi:ATP-binding cassette subfamily F protein 3